MLTPIQIIDHAEYALRGILVTSYACWLTFWVTYLSDEVRP